MDLVVDDYVSWCDADSGSVDLAERVIPSITIGTESDNPPRLTGFGGDDPEDFTTGAETLQDGLITLELALNETDGLDDNLEVFMEDVLVIQIIKNNAGDQPSYTYDPDTRDATLHIPDKLKEECSNMTYSESFFGCVYKHVLAEEEITDPEWAYKVGSASSRREGHASPTTAQDFMETMLGDGTASVAARELGRDFEQYLLNEGFATRKKIGLWINPGHVWGQTAHNSEYSLSKDVVLYVLFGVRSGVDGTTRRMLLQAGGDGRSALLQTISYSVTAADVVEELLEDVVAVEVTAQMALSAEEACMPHEELVAVCAQKLESAVAPHASEVDAVHIVSVAGADCARRAASSPVATVDAVVALEMSANAYIDMEAAVASGALLSLEASDGEPLKINTPQPAEPESASEGDNNAAMIGAAAGAAVAVVVMSVVGWRASRSCKSQDEPLQEVVSTAAPMEREGSQPFNKLWPTLSHQQHCLRTLTISRL